jgi:hypothetical protein
MAVIIFLNLSRKRIIITCIDGYVESCGDVQSGCIQKVTFVDKNNVKYYFNKLAGSDSIQYNTFTDFKKIPPGKFALIYSMPILIGRNNLDKRDALLYAYKESETGETISFEDDYIKCASVAYVAEFWPRFIVGAAGLRLSRRYIIASCCSLFLLASLTVLTIFFIERSISADNPSARLIMSAAVLTIMIIFFVGNHTIGIYRRRNFYRYLKRVAENNGIY